jgi:large subunit ribosomal protein L21
MRYAIVESGGKQYRAVEGATIEVDRLAADKGKQIELERVLLMADGDEFMIGTPTVGGIQVKATVVDHLRGEKVVHFKYSPKKRIRVRGGHRQQYTRLMVDFIGKPGESRKVEKAEAKPVEKKARAVSKTKQEKPIRSQAKQTKAVVTPPAKRSTNPGKSTAKKPTKKKSGK